MHQICSFCAISMFIINTKLIFLFYFSINFMFLENEIKVRSKFYKKIHFRNLESLCDVMENKWLCWILLEFSNVFGGRFYLMHQIRSYFMFWWSPQIWKLIFIFCFSLNFMFLENEIKVCLKIYFLNLKSLCDYM